MTSSMKDEHTQNQGVDKAGLKVSVLERLEKDRVCPRSRLFFQFQEIVVWVLWVLSVVVGALAIAVSLFVFTYYQYALYEATHDNFFTFLVDVLPYLWIVIFGLMVLAASYNLRHTKHGYRYPVWSILLSSVVMSVVGGFTLQYFGFGYEIDESLGHWVPAYRSQEKYEHQLWQQPQAGRLFGRQVLSTLAPTTTIIFEDNQGTRWQMRVTELDDDDLALLATAKPVRLIGKVLDDEERIFHACGVFPWMMDDYSVTMDDMQRERQRFIQHVIQHMRKLRQDATFYASSTVSTSTPSRQSVCATIAPVHRMSVSLPPEAQP